MSKGVLVQGPPGTGKSHTISNLICHLLAEGKRVLITAKTSNALKVLRDKIPEDIRSLVVTLLGAGSEEKKILEESVGGILNRSNSWEKEKEARRREELENKLDRLKRNKESEERRRREIIESETRNQSVACGRYSGTAAEIAKIVNKEQNDYAWFKDNVEPDKEFPFPIGEMQNALESAKKFKNRKEDFLLDVCDVISAEEFESLIAALEETSELNDEPMIELGIKFQELSAESVEELLDKAKCLHDAERRFAAFGEWVTKEFNKIKSKQSCVYDISEIIDRMLPDLELKVNSIDDYEIEFPSDLLDIRIRDDAKQLRDFINDGKDVSKWNPFIPKSIRNCFYIFEEVKINQKPCSKSIEDLDILISCLDFRIEIDKIWRLLKDITSPKSELLACMQIQEAKRINEIIREILCSEKVFNEYCDCVKLIFPDIDPLSNSDLKQVIAKCPVLLVKIRRADALQKLSSLENQLAAFIKKDKAHIIMSNLLNAVCDKNVDLYKEQKQELDSFVCEKLEYEHFREAFKKIHNVIPKTALEMVNSCDDLGWTKRLNEIEKAWHWSQANNWITEYNKDDIPSIEASLKQIEKSINDTLLELTSLRAWNFCMDRLSPAHIRSMELWQQSVRKLGKGTGKYANKYRSEAQKHLSKSIEAVPAWIMPLCNVWENIKIEKPGIFDLVIIDEASQCGLEALPLLYLAKRILIVGDDKQISPSNVGLKQDEIHRCRNEYLKDLESPELFDINNSLFDIGEVLFGGTKVVLREHFRCMPEIIKFSNRICYSEMPLIPMRQFGADRLPPLEHVFCGGGYKEGDGQNAINKVEAEAIVNRIVEICHDEKYNGKIIGVIALQGGKNQASLIEQGLLDKLGANKIDKKNIECGDAYNFQGDERDVVLLSMIVANNAPFSALTAERYKQRFNVSMSRARDQVILFHSVKTSDLSPTCLRRKLIEHFEGRGFEPNCGEHTLEELERLACASNRSSIEPPNPFDSWFEADVAIEIMRRGYRVITQYEVGSKRIDLVVEGEQSKLAVECDGDRWHNKDNYEEDMYRQRQLERCGWEFFRVRSSFFYRDKAGSLEKLWNLLSERGIFPHNIQA